MASRLMVSGKLRRAGFRSLQSAWRPNPTPLRHPPVFLLPVICSSGSVAASPAAHHSAPPASSVHGLHTSAVRLAKKKPTFNDRKQELSKWNAARNAKRRLGEKWDPDFKYKTEPPKDELIGWRKRREKRLTILQERLRKSAELTASKTGEPVKVEDYSLEHSFRQRSRSLTMELKRRIEQIKTLDPQAASELFEESQAYLKKEMKVLKVLLRTKDPKGGGYNAATVNIARIRAPWNSLIVLATTAGKLEAGLHALNTMSKYGFHANASSYTAALNGIYKKQCEKHAHKVERSEPLFKPESKNLQRARELFKDFELLWKQAIPQFFGKLHGVPYKTRAQMERELNEDEGRDTRRLRMLSHQSAILEMRERPNVMTSTINVYLRILLAAKQDDEAWELFRRICPAPGSAGTRVAPLADRATFTTMLSAIPSPHPEGDSAEASAARFKQLQEIWKRWEGCIQAAIARLPESQRPLAVRSEAPSADDEQSVDAALWDEDDGPDRVPPEKRIMGDEDPVADLARVVPEEHVVSLLFTKLYRAQPEEQKIMFRVMRTCFGIDDSDRSGLLKLNPHADGIELVTDGEGSSNPPLVELRDSSMSDLVLRTFAYQSNWQVCVTYFNQFLALGLAGFSSTAAGGAARCWPCGPLLSQRGLVSTIVALGFAPDPLGQMLLLKTSCHRSMPRPTEATFARVLKSIAYSADPRSRDFGGLTKQVMDRDGADAYDAWGMARDVFELYCKNRGAWEREAEPEPERGSAPQQLDEKTESILYSLLAACNRLTSFSAADPVECLVLLERFAPDLRTVADALQGGDETDHIKTRVLEELYMTLANALEPPSGGQHPTRDQVERWKELKNDLAKYRTDRYEKRWLTQGVNSAGNGATGLKLSEEDFKDLENEDILDEEDEKPARPTRRSLAMDRELERWVKG
ncbi:hypothetical protein ACQY0O_004660 [Thecaphora frezii]